jgi:hypothetical protein
LLNKVGGRLGGEVLTESTELTELFLGRGRGVFDGINKIKRIGEAEVSHRGLKSGRKLEGGSLGILTELPNFRN